MALLLPRSQQGCSEWGMRPWQQWGGLARPCTGRRWLWGSASGWGGSQNPASLETAPASGALHRAHLPEGRKLLPPLGILLGAALPPPPPHAREALQSFQPATKLWLDVAGCPVPPPPSALATLSWQPARPQGLALCRVQGTRGPAMPWGASCSGDGAEQGSCGGHKCPRLCVHVRDGAEGAAGAGVQDGQAVGLGLGQA